MGDQKFCFQFRMRRFAPLYALCGQLFPDTFVSTKHPQLTDMLDEPVRVKCQVE